MTFSESFKRWDNQHKEDINKGVPGSFAIYTLFMAIVSLSVIAIIVGIVWLFVLLCMAFHWGVLWFIGGGILTIWIGRAVMYLFASITRLKESK